MKTSQECCDKFSVRPDRGLTSEQVKDNLAKYGPNGKKDNQTSVKSFCLFVIKSN